MFSSRIPTTAVVAILVVTSFTSAADRTPGEIYSQLLRSTAMIRVGNRQGTGWVVDHQRHLVVTNSHVVGKDEFVTACFPEFREGKLIVESRYYRDNETGLARKGRLLRGQVVAADPRRDLVVVQLPSLPEDVQPLRLSRHQAAPSDRVHSLGNPGASDALWVYTTGTVRQVYRNRFQYQDGQQVDAMVLETQAPLNPGDSGGPVVNDQGELVGVNAAGKTNAQLVSLSIERSEVQAMLDGLATSVSKPAAVASRHDRIAPKPRNPTAADYNNRGVDFHQAEQYDRALFEYAMALQLDPNYALAYKNRALTWFKIATLSRGSRGYLKQAIADYSSALTLNPKDAEALHQRGLAHGRLGEGDRAIADYSAALEINPELTDVYQSRRKAYLAKGDMVKAEADLDQIVRRKIR